MKKTLKITGLGIALLASAISCKKNEKADPMPEGHHVENHQTEQVSHTTAKFEKLDHDFGTLKKGDVVQYVYEITNTGDKPLIISTVKPACGCTAPNYTTEPIAPGQKGSVTLSFDSANFSGVTTKTAEVYTNTDNSPFVLSFKANVQE